MTPRRLDPDTVHAKLRRMEQVLADLEGVGPVDADRLAGEPVVRYGVERMLCHLVEIAASINSHVASAVIEETPADYHGSFSAAARAGAIPEELAASLAPSAGLRNVLVHEYEAVDLGKVAAAVPLAVDGFRAFVAQVARFLVERTPG